jgi:hypothetical protein
MPVEHLRHQTSTNLAPELSTLKSATTVLYWAQPAPRRGSLAIVYRKRKIGHEN